MKNVIILLVALFSISMVHAQKMKAKDVPNDIASAFQKKYPNVKKVEWEKENNHYEVEFETEDGEEYSVLIDGNGNILETEMEISVNELPLEAMAYLKKNYEGKKIKEAARITDRNGVVTYEAEVKGKDLIFNSNGKFLKVVSEADKD